MTYLLDTNVLSESVSARPDEKVIAWLKATPLADTYISAITIGEIKRGIEKLPDTHPRKSQLNEWLENEVLRRFSGRIVPIDAALMLQWGKLIASLERQGRTLPLMDSLLAAQAIYHQLTLVTRNVKDFSDTGVALIDPWA